MIMGFLPAAFADKIKSVARYARRLVENPQ
jgi:hypothetical protein